MRVEDTIRQKLTDLFAQMQAEGEIEVIDESHLHAGHAGAPEGGQSHFRVRIVSPAFDGRTRVDRQRMVYDALSAELAGPVHALALKTLTPAEAARA